ncbi:MAG TPA: helix-turn-helix domain-containing protein [Saprospiraceae bacterium]|nr:helix-turn-helix domain-containing protein [Saprospiraceae bacterium]HPG08351.1 helix-turn-helix domain-containing protein [Saprospiraceae bacterium]HQU51934.1 helix-turn-helix domain-containing protein [Saprospiraceae bacterium]HRV85606.1 helix-turn-helix domain-containing protein [Saprospiraceae bacterium]
MSDDATNKEDFLSQATSVVVENASNDQFGVSEMAGALNMSRSTLLRKIKSTTNQSASQFIRQIRLEIAMELLKETSGTVSEISFKVGFGSVSYFIKCFREQYGYPPGEVGKREVDKEVHTGRNTSGKFSIRMALVATLLLMIMVALFRYGRYWSTPGNPEVLVEKSIAVLPFKNESSDSSNLYFVNGLMESTLNNLQKIKDLRVISRSSVEIYRNSDKTIREIAEELQVSYFIEGSGQKVGDQVLLNIQLIDAKGDRQIWAEQYNRKLVDIFALQNEVATKTAHAIEAIVTPAELEQIKKKPTDNLVAYDFYLQALDPFYSRTNEGLLHSIELFDKAIDADSEFALAYAHVAMAYYLLEMFQADKKYTDQINAYADKALLYDPKSAESLTAKAFYYIQIKEYRLALPHLEKALEYNPNSSLAVQMLADFYFRLVPNANKYLEYALEGVRLNVAPSDSVTKSYIYLQLSNALLNLGFIDEAYKYINLSLDYNANNYYSPHLKAFILFARDGAIRRTRNLLFREWEQDTTRLDILQDIAKMYYLEYNYDSSYVYFRRFVDTRKRNGLAIYVEENAKIALVYAKMGLTNEAAELFHDFSTYCDRDQSIYHSVNMAVKYAYEGKIDSAIAQLNIFSESDNFQYWFLLIEDEPIFKPLKAHPEFPIVMQKIKDRFWQNHDRIKRSLEERGLL